jgi:hypothetical protein
MDKIKAGGLLVILAAYLSPALPRDAGGAFIELSAVRPPPTVFDFGSNFEVNFELTLEAGDSISRGDALEFVFAPYLVRSERGAVPAIVDIQNFGLIDLPEDRDKTLGNPLAARRIYQEFTLDPFVFDTLIGFADTNPDFWTAVD